MTRFVELPSGFVFDVSAIEYIEPHYQYVKDVYSVNFSSGNHVELSEDKGSDNFYPRGKLIELWKITAGGE